jgi:hypothetical protein
VKYIYGIILCIACLSVSCFKKEDIIPLQKYDGQAFVFTQSIYNDQFYYDLGTNRIISQNPNEKWDISFDCKKNSGCIRINSSKLLAAWPTQGTNFNKTDFPLNSGNWRYDKSDGNPDSTAISHWVNKQNNPFLYSNEIFIIGQYDGIKYNPLKKIMFYELTDSSYRFKYANLDGSNFNDIYIKLDTSYNNIFFNFDKKDTLIIEPPKSKWDLLFSQYTTTLFTDAGVAVPYFVRGTLINPYKVTAAVDSVQNYSNIQLTSIQDFNFSSDRDIIGYNWKSVEVNEQTNTANYAIRNNYNYIIKDTEDNYFKIKFISFYNSTKIPGYPTFIINKL